LNNSGQEQHFLRDKAHICGSCLAHYVGTLLSTLLCCHRREVNRRWQAV
jgi:hypothetical protein